MVRVVDLWAFCKARAMEISCLSGTGAPACVAPVTKHTARGGCATNREHSVSHHLQKMKRSANAALHRYQPSQYVISRRAITVKLEAVTARLSLQLSYLIPLPPPPPQFKVGDPSC